MKTYYNSMSGYALVSVVSLMGFYDIHWGSICQEKFRISIRKMSWKIAYLKSPTDLTRANEISDKYIDVYALFL